MFSQCQAQPKTLEEAKSAAKCGSLGGGAGGAGGSSGRAREIYGETYGALETKLLQLQLKGRQAGWHFKKERLQDFSQSIFFNNFHKFCFSFPWPWGPCATRHWMVNWVAWTHLQRLRHHRKQLHSLMCSFLLPLTPNTWRL